MGAVILQIQDMVEFGNCQKCTDFTQIHPFLALLRTRQRLTRRVYFTLAQSSNQPVFSIPWTHAQLNIKGRLRVYGNKVDDATLKELSQLHTQQAIIQCNKDEMSYNERKRLFAT